MKPLPHHSPSLFVTGFEDAHVLRRVRLIATPCTVAHRTPLSVGILRQEYWSGLPLASPGDLPDPGIKLVSPVLADEFFTTEPHVKPQALKKHTGKQLNTCTCLEESHSRVRKTRS